MSGHYLQIDIESFCYRAARRPQLSNLHVSLEGGKPYALLGPSGSGKSTLLNALLPEPNGILVGTVRYGDGMIFETPDEVCRSGKLGLMSQSPGLLPWRTIRQNLRVPARLCAANVDLPTVEHCRQMLNSVSLSEEVLHRHPHELSFGMRQRIALARSMMLQPKFLLLDEVFTGLDVATAGVIESMVCAYTKLADAVTLIITHDIEIAVRSSRSVLYMNKLGSIEQLSEDCTAEEITGRFAKDLNV